MHQAKYIAWIFIPLLLLGIYYPMLGYSFVNFDDTRFIINNEWIKDVNLVTLKQMFTESKEGHFQPLMWLLYSFEYSMFGLNPLGYHIISLLLHLSNVFMVMHLAKYFFKNKEHTYFLGLLMICHPIFVEAIAWKSAQSTLLSAFFACLSLLVLVCWIKKDKSVFLVAAYLFFLMACLSKSQVLFISVWWILVLYFLRSNDFKMKVLYLVPAIFISLFFGILAILSSKEFGSLAPTIGLYSWLDRVFIISYACFFYIQKILLPVGFSAIHFNPLKENGALPWYYYLSLLGLCVFWGVAYFKISTKKALFVVIAVFFSSIALVSQVLPVGNTVAAERYAYFSSMVVLSLLIHVFFIGTKYLKWRKWILLIGCFVLAFLSRKRLEVWGSNFSLYSNMIEQYPDQYYAYYAFGVTLYDLAWYPHAITYLNKGDMLNKESSKINLALGKVYQKTQMLDSSYVHFSKAIALDVRCMEAYLGRAEIAVLQKKYSQAIRDLTIYLAMNKQDTKALKLRASAKYLAKDYQGSMIDLKQLENLLGSTPEIIKNQEMIRKKLN